MDFVVIYCFDYVPDHNAPRMPWFIVVVHEILGALIVLKARISSWHFILSLEINLMLETLTGSLDFRAHSGENSEFDLIRVVYICLQCLFFFAIESKS